MTGFSWPEYKQTKQKLIKLSHLVKIVKLLLLSGTFIQTRWNNFQFDSILFYNAKIKLKIQLAQLGFQHPYYFSGIFLPGLNFLENFIWNIDSIKKISKFWFWVVSSSNLYGSFLCVVWFFPFVLLFCSIYGERFNNLTLACFFPVHCLFSSGKCMYVYAVYLGCLIWVSG